MRQNLNERVLFTRNMTDAQHTSLETIRLAIVAMQQNHEMALLAINNPGGGLRLDQTVNRANELIMQLELMYKNFEQVADSYAKLVHGVSEATK